MDYERFDKIATIRARAAIESKEQSWDLMRACREAQLDYPYTDDDLRSVVRVLDSWGIRWNCDKEAFVKKLLIL